MSEDLSAWLGLREAADARARSTVVTAALAAALPAVRPLRCVDLASGTGANIRYLATRLPRPQDWLAVDRDAALLAQVPAGVFTRCMDLGNLDGPRLFAGRQLVTASALLDLVSEAWIRGLARQCRRAECGVLFALVYDGRSTCDPAEHEDDEIRRMFNLHQQRSDKGFGIAAGPEAPAIAAGCLAEEGYVVRRERSDWELTASEAALQRALVRGWADASIEIAPGQARAIRGWLARRLGHIDDGRSRIVVGHEDLAAWLA